MTWIQIAAVAGAAVVVAGPEVVKWLMRRRPASAARIGYQDSMLALATVRSRLASSGEIAEPAKAAIEVLTLALVETSDR